MKNILNVMYYKYEIYIFTKMTTLQQSLPEHLIHMDDDDLLEWYDEDQNEIYDFKNQEIEDSSYEISNLKLSEFDEIFIDFPSKAATSFKKINGYWYQTKPYQTRADQNIVYRLLSILAAKSKEKLESLQIEKYGLDKPKLKMTFSNENQKEVFSFGTYNPVTEQQYVLYDNSVYILDGIFSEMASYLPVELIDKKPLAPFEKVMKFDFSRLEQWQENYLRVEIDDMGKIKADGKKIDFDEMQLAEWFTENWLKAVSTSVEPHKFDARIGYKSFDVYLDDKAKITFYRIQESPELLLFRKDEGLLYHFPQDSGFTMLNPNVSRQD